MKTNPCVSIQEEIAWGRTLSPESQLHVLSCENCQKVSLEFSKLDSAFAETLDEKQNANDDLNPLMVPVDFTDRVMNRIHEEEKTNERKEWFANFGSRLQNFFQLRPVQVTIALWIAFSMGRAF